MPFFIRHSSPCTGSTGHRSACTITHETHQIWWLLTAACPLLACPSRDRGGMMSREMKKKRKGSLEHRSECLCVLTLPCGWLKKKVQVNAKRFC